MPGTSWAVILDPAKLAAICNSSDDLEIYYNTSTMVAKKVYQGHSECPIGKAKLEAKILSAREQHKQLDLNLDDAEKSQISDGEPTPAPTHLDAAEVFKCSFEKSYLQPPVNLALGGCNGSLLMAFVRCQDELGNHQMSTTVACNARFRNDPTACFKDYVGRKTETSVSNEPGDPGINLGEPAL